MNVSLCVPSLSLDRRRGVLVIRCTQHLGDAVPDPLLFDALRSAGRLPPGFCLKDVASPMTQAEAGVGASHASSSSTTSRLMA
jgi:hypothetical protein